MTIESNQIIESYLRGEISLGKLAQKLDLDPISARDFLKSHGVKLQTCDTLDIQTDSKNA